MSDDLRDREAEGRHLRMRRLQLDLLRALASAPDGTGTVDDGTATVDLRAAYRDGGKWRGPAVRELHEVIAPVTDRAGRRASLLSRRPSRHRSTVTVWQIVDRDAARRRIDELEQWLAAQPAEPRQPTLFD